MRGSRISALAALMLHAAVALGQEASSPPPPPPSSSGLGQDEGSVDMGSPSPDGPIVYEKPKTVEVFGKPADELSDDEVQEFLQGKVRDIYQSLDSVVVIRVSPGYPVTLNYEENLGAPIIGDPSLITATVAGKSLVLAAKSETGDTSMVVPISGNRMLPYHVFVDPTFAKTDTLLRIHVQDSTTSSSSGKSDLPEPDLSQIASVIGNYDALKQEKAIDPRFVKRIPVGRKSAFGKFYYYDWFIFADGTAAITFGATAGGAPLNLPRSRFRLQAGDMRFLPDMVVVGAPRLPAGGTTGGYLIFRHPPFVSTQPLKIVEQAYEIVLQ